MALGEGVEIDRAAPVRSLADLALAVVRLDREQDAAAIDFEDARGRHDRATDRRRREMADIDLASDDSALHPDFIALRGTASGLSLAPTLAAYTVVISIAQPGGQPCTLGSHFWLGASR